jgi:hypothetical protein
MAEYNYWAVKCKTEKCGWILIDCIGLVQPHRFPIVPPCGDFEVVCDGCKVASIYSGADLTVKIAEIPCRDHVPIATFQDAIRKAQHPGETPAP